MKGDEVLGRDCPTVTEFIDNHFVERLEVHKKLGIPVFDVEAFSFFVR